MIGIPMPRVWPRIKGGLTGPQQTSQERAAGVRNPAVADDQAPAAADPVAAVHWDPRLWGELT